MLLPIHTSFSFSLECKYYNLSVLPPDHRRSILVIHCLFPMDFFCLFLSRDHAVTFNNVQVRFRVQLIRVGVGPSAVYSHTSIQGHYPTG